VYYYFQKTGGEEKWKACPASYREQVAKDEVPTFFTVLSVSKLVEDLPYEEKQKLKYEGPFYADWDGKDIAEVAEKFNSFIVKLEELKLDMSMVKLYATGGKGFHLEIPQLCFMEKLSKDGVQSLPTIYREMALELYVDTLDLRVYSQGAGRMWRTTNKLRANGKHKVQITLAEAKAMTVESYEEICATPRQPMPVTEPRLCLDLSLIYSRAAQKVEEKMKKRAKSKPDPQAKTRAAGPSIGLMMMGQGIKEGVGFQHIAMQLAIAATTAGTPIESFIEQCAGLIANHEGDGSRYNTPAKRTFELERMYQYVDGNPMYEFSIGAIKTLLTHEAPDLDGLSVDRADVEESIAEAAVAGENLEPDEFDVAGGVTLSKYGVYVDSEFGKKRVCAISFADTFLLRSCETGEINMYETAILVNGKNAGRKSLEKDVFATTLAFNRFCASYGHAYSGSDLQLRGVFMRFIEQAKKKGGVQFITKREGLDVITIANHENPELRKPFLVWSDNRGVLLDPRAGATDLQMQFKGFPDTYGSYKTDIADAPKLGEWLKEDGNRDSLKRTLTALMTCQEPVLLSNLIGWHVACYWRMLFHKAFDKFPMLHVHGSAGAGKTEMTMAMQSLYYYNTEPSIVTPSSTVYAIQERMAGSASIPLVIDEYKASTMAPGQHDRMKGLIREAYNCRGITKGGGTRDNSDYRILHTIQVSSPMLFISESMEEESAVMERVVLLSVVKPPTSVSLRRLTLFLAFRKNKQQLAILGQYIASKILMSYSVDRLREEFEPMYEEAKAKYMLTEADMSAGLTKEELDSKRGAVDRTVYNYTVSRFGFMKFREVINSALDKELDGLMGTLEDATYQRMGDLKTSTQAEYLKVLSMLSTMSWAVEEGKPDALRRGHDYAFYNLGGKDVIEIFARPCYIRYRSFCRNGNMQPLGTGPEAFLMSLKDSAAIVPNHGLGRVIAAPEVYAFDVAELAKLGVAAFKP
jgi:hypothetical protein